MRPGVAHIREAFRRWPWLFAAFGLALVLGTIAVGITLTRRETEQQVLTSFHTRGESSAGFVSTFLSEEANRESQTALSLLAGRRTSSADFRVIVASYGSPAAVLLDRSGRVLQVAPRDPAIIGSELGTRYAHLRAAEAGHVAVSGVVPSAVKHEPIIAIAVPYHTRFGRRVLSIAFPVAQSLLATLVKHTVDQTPHRALLTDADGTIIAGNPVPSGSTIRQADPALAAAIARSSEGDVKIAGVSTRYISANVPGTSWHLVIAVADHDLFSSIDGSPKWLPWIVFSALGFFGLLALGLLARSLGARQRLADLTHQLATAARTDPLTGLLNRRGLEEQLVQASAHAERAGSPLSALMIDLDRFKQINDAHGHETGDQVLRLVAESMRAAFRAQDILGRWGGDEFLVLLVGTDLDGAHDACRRLCVHTSAITHPADAAQRITLSVGAAIITTNGEDLIRQADIALYQAKRARPHDTVVTV